MENTQDLWSGKTSPEHSQVTKVKTSDAYSKKSSAFQSREFLFLNLRGGGRWSYSGTIMGDGYSVAWRTFDAQYWGVPQRRRRIYLVADFGGECAPQILFECKSLSWNPTQSRLQRQEAAGDFGEGAPLTDQERGAIPIENHPNDSRVGICEDGRCQTLTSRMGTGGATYHS